MVRLASLASEPRAKPTPHEYDHDSCCIHCGHDGAEEHWLRSLGYAIDRAPCPVWDEDTRAENRRRFLEPPEYDDGDPEFGLIDADVGDWDDEF